MMTLAIRIKKYDGVSNLCILTHRHFFYGLINFFIKAVALYRNSAFRDVGNLRYQIIPPIMTIRRV